MAYHSQFTFAKKTKGKVSYPNILYVNRENLVLYAHQVPAFQRSLEILRDRKNPKNPNLPDTLPCVVNVSPMGAGKTFYTLALVTTLDIPYCVIGPSESVWLKEISRYKTSKYLGYMSYHALSNSSKCPFAGNQPLTSQVDRVTEEGRVFKTFHPTQALRDLCTSRVAFIFDEAHALKNETSNRNRIGRVIISEILYAREHKKESIYIMLSATLFDKFKHTKGMLRTMNVLTAEEMYGVDQFGGTTVVGFGAWEIAQKCALYDEQRALSVMHKTDEFGTPLYNPINKDNASAFIGDMYFEVIKPTVTVEIPSVVIKRMTYQGFFAIVNDTNGVRTMSILQGIADLKEAIKRVLDNDDNSADNFGKITKALEQIEVGCAPEYVRLSIAKIFENPPRSLNPAENNFIHSLRNKVIISLNYHASIDIVRAGLRAQLNYYNTTSPYKEYIYTYLGGPLEFVEYHGRISREDRDYNVTRFQNEPRVKFFVMTTKSGGIAISLNDSNEIENEKTGDTTLAKEKIPEPRTMYVQLDYDMTAVHQATGRIFRTNQASVGEAFIFSPLLEETPIMVLDALARKSAITGKTITGINEVIFPGSYARYVEGFSGADGKGSPYIDEAELSKRMAIRNAVPEMYHDNVNIQTGEVSRNIYNVARGFLRGDVRWIPTFGPGGPEKPDLKELDKFLDKTIGHIVQVPPGYNPYASPYPNGNQFGNFQSNGQEYYYLQNQQPIQQFPGQQQQYPTQQYGQQYQAPQQFPGQLQYQAPQQFPTQQYGQQFPTQQYGQQFPTQQIPVSMNGIISSSNVALAPAFTFSGLQLPDELLNFEINLDSPPALQPPQSTPPIITSIVPTQNISANPSMTSF